MADTKKSVSDEGALEVTINIYIYIYIYIKLKPPIIYIAVMKNGSDLLTKTCLCLELYDIY